METGNLVCEAVNLLSQFLQMNTYSKSSSVKIGRFLSAVERIRADSLILFVRNLISKNRKSQFTSKKVLKMPLSRMAKKLMIEHVPKKIVFVLDSIEKIKFFLSKTRAQNWKFVVEIELKKLMKLGRKLGELGLNIQFIFISSVHLDLQIPNFIMHFMSEDFLVEKVGKLMSD